MKTPLSSIVLVLIGSFIGSFGAVFLKAGAHTMSRNWKSLLLNYRLAAGIALYLLSSVFCNESPAACARESLDDVQGSVELPRQIGRSKAAVGA